MPVLLAKILGGAFSLVKDPRTLMTVGFVVLALFMDWRGDVRAQQVTDLKEDINRLEQAHDLSMKELKASIGAGRIAQDRDKQKTRNDEIVGDIINDIENSPESEDGPLAPIARSTNDRLNCLLDPSRCAAPTADASDNADSPTKPVDLRRGSDLPDE